MLEKQKMLWVNQLAAQIKLVGMWKSKNTENYPVKIDFRATRENKTETRGATSGKVVETERPCKARATFVGYITRLWNRAPKSITQAETMGKVKSKIRKYCRTLPI